jgi:hypothetical protein
MEVHFSLYRKNFLTVHEKKSKCFLPKYIPKYISQDRLGYTPVKQTNKKSLGFTVRG